MGLEPDDAVDPDRDAEPRTQAYEVPCHPDWKVLDALNYIKDELDPSLSHRWSCRMAICGSCGLMINGIPKQIPYTDFPMEAVSLYACWDGEHWVIMLPSEY